LKPDVEKATVLVCLIIAVSPFHIINGDAGDRPRIGELENYEAFSIAITSLICPIFILLRGQ